MTRASDDSRFLEFSKPRPLLVQDMLRMERVGDVTPSPDGRWVLFSRKTWNREVDKTSANLWIVSIDGATMLQLTSAGYHIDSSSVWSPDGRSVAFVSNRGGSQQIWTVDVDEGKARQLTDFPLDVGNLRWSPTGAYISFSSDVYLNASDFEATANRDKESANDPMRFDRLFVRHWDSWSRGKRSHIFLLPVKHEKSGWIVDGAPIDLMKGVDGDCPTKPFGGSEEYAWSPDGKEIAYTTHLGNDEAWCTDLNIYLVSVSGNDVRCITSENRAIDTQPVYSPNGRTIAYLATERPGYESDRRRIKLYERKSSETRTLTEAWDRSPSSLTWSPDGKELYATVSETGRQKIFAIDAISGRPRIVVCDHYNFNVHAIADTTGPSRSEVGCRLVFEEASLTEPAEIWTVASDGSNKRRLTSINYERLKLSLTSKPEEFFFIGALGQEVQAWFLKPTEFVDKRKYPVTLIIHGGPQRAAEDNFTYLWNLQPLAAAGYAVIAINFHGSTGFGQAFTDSISRNWGGLPFEDLMKGLDHALVSYSWLDGDRVAALGGSFGGWMINWVNGHTNRFNCLVNHDGGFDSFSNYFTTDELWFPEWEFGGVPWEKPALFDKFSPARYVANWRTPTLVVHGGRDYRRVEAESVATFTALQRRSVPSRFIYFPNEGHFVLKPKNLILWYEEVIAWLDRWLKQKQSFSESQVDD